MPVAGGRKRLERRTPVSGGGFGGIRCEARRLGKSQPRRGGSIGFRSSDRSQAMDRHAAAVRHTAFHTAGSCAIATMPPVAKGSDRWPRRHWPIIARTTRKKLTDFMLVADTDSEFQPLALAIRSHRGSVSADLRERLRQSSPADAAREVRDALWKRQANAAVCLLGLDEQDAVWPLLKQSDNPSLRGFIIERLRDCGSLPPAGRTFIARNRSVDSAGRDPGVGRFDTGKLSNDARQATVTSGIGLSHERR